MGRLIRMTAMLVAMMSLWLAAAAQETVGEIAKVNGIAKLERGGKDFEVTLAMPLAIGDQLRTSANTEVSVTFKDGSRLELGESTSCTIDQYAITGSRRTKGLVALWGGHLRSIVKVLGGDAPNFEVHTPNAVAAVRGTEFETAFIDGRPCPEDRSCMRYTTVGVSKGVVAVSNPSNSAPPVEVGEGYETTVACASAATSPAPLGMQGMGAPGYH
ncbi:MAG TPA: FecR family protein [Candidatus Binataceae bacterium]|nr:FecR family protein [Candidatus Binataceae bacterium]